jgi:hypothetical protein
MVCSKCSQELKNGLKFCTKCGHKIILQKLKNIMLIIVSIFLFLILLFIGRIFFKTYQQKSIYKNRENQLISTAKVASTFLTAEELDRYHTVEDSKKQSYQELKIRLEQFANEYNVLYVSYLRQYDQDNFQYIIDNDFDPRTIVGPGTVVPIENIARSALAGNVTTTDFRASGSRGLITGFAPVYDKNNNFYCVVMVEISFF